MCRAVLGAAADAVCRAGASRLVTPATVPVARSRAEVSEAVLAGLAGEPFQAASRAASEMADDIARWTTPVTSDRAARLTVRLSPPEDDGGWLLSVEAQGEPGPNGEGPSPSPSRRCSRAAGRPGRPPWRPSCAAWSGCCRRCAAPDGDGAGLSWTAPRPSS